MQVYVHLAGLTYYLLGSDEEEEATASVTNDDNPFILSPDQVVDVYDGDTFKIDLPSMHPLFGDDLSIRLFGVDTPEMRGTTDEVKALAMQAQELTEKALKGASIIELRNPQRGKYFRVVSEVWIDGESLSLCCSWKPKLPQVPFRNRTYEIFCIPRTRFTGGSKFIFSLPSCRSTIFSKSPPIT